MNGKKFSWLPVLLISLVAQYLLLEIIIYLELRIFPTLNHSITVFINFLVIAFLGGFLGIHYYFKSSLHIGGICAAIFIVLHRLYYGYELLNFAGVVTVLLAYFAGYLGGIFHKKILFNRTLTA